MTDKHFLITVSDASSMAGIHFISSFFRNKERMKATLLYVAPSSRSKEPVFDEAWLPPDEKAKVKIPSSIQHTLNSSCKLLNNAGLSSENINTKIAAKLQSKVKDIINEGQRGNYDAVIFGRRAVSRLEKLLDESVTDEILTQNTKFPLWICRNPEAGRKNILLCLDGSETAMRVTDHVGYMVGDQEDHQITLFHVAHGQKVTIDKVFDEARNRLLEHNVPEENIVTKTIHSMWVNRAIRQEIEAQKYAVVAIGLLGRKLEGVSEWFISSKSLELVKKVDKVVLWGCH